MHKISIVYKRHLHLLIIVFVNALFILSHFYCDYKSFGTLEPSDELVEKIGTNEWWTLRCNLYAITFLVFSFAQYLPKHLISYFFINLLVGFSVSDVIDRTYYDINHFTKEDIYMILINVALSTFLYKKCILRKVKKLGSTKLAY